MSDTENSDCTPRGDDPIITIRDLHKRFGGHHVLRGVSLKIMRGESFVILGRSGCGKSVLLKHMIGVMHPDSGRVMLNHRDVTEMTRQELNEARRRFGMVFQGGALFDSMSVEENVGFALAEHTRMKRDEISKIVREKLGLVGLSGTEGLMPAELSGGMMKRVALARAIAFEPEIILYDEPTTGLDPVTADSINKLMAKMQSTLGVTSIIVTHDLKCAYEVGDRVAMLEGGVVKYCDSKKEAPRSDNAEMRRFFEASGVVFGD
jgi:phospholipid/cholesterol/gamma-HCH transport system ATP-binding protein